MRAVKAVFVSLTILSSPGCRTGEKTEKPTTDDVAAAPAKPHPAPPLNALVERLPLLKTEASACKTEECKREVHARSAALAVQPLTEHRIATSLVDVERAVSAWQRGEATSMSAHGAILAHTARCDLATDRLAAAVSADPEAVLRDALDAGLLSADDFVQLVGAQPASVAPAHTLSDTPANAQDKRRRVEKYLDRMHPVLIHLDARKLGVVVPTEWDHDPELVLRIGRELEPAVPDLVVDDTGVSASLTFHGKPFHCVLPWPAIYAAFVEGDTNGTVWADDVPDEVTTPR